LFLEQSIMTRMLAVFRGIEAIATALPGIVQAIAVVRAISGAAPHARPL